MVIKVLQQSTFRRYAAKVLSITIFNFFFCSRCANTPLRGVINLRFLHLLINDDNDNKESIMINYDSIA